MLNNFYCNSRSHLLLLRTKKEFLLDLFELSVSLCDQVEIKIILGNAENGNYAPRMNDFA